MTRVTVLDGLRAAAVLIVMISHAGLGHVVPGGFGVTMFFVLSGYLITHLLLIEFENKGQVSYSAFYLRRTVRILPPLALCYVTATGLVLTFDLNISYNVAGVVWDIALVSNYASSLGQPSNIPIPLWSLNIEEHFYVVFPATFVAILSRHRGWLMPVLVLLLALALVVRYIEFSRGNASNIYYWTHTRYDMILFGSLLATVQRYGAVKIRKMLASYPAVFIAALAIILTFLVRDPFFRETIRYSVQGVALLVVFAFLLSDKITFASTVSEWKPIRLTAEYSYVLYLIHLPIFTFVENYYSDFSSVFQHILGFGLSFLFAAATHRFMERPLLQWRKRIEKGLQPKGALRPKGLE